MMTRPCIKTALFLAAAALLWPAGAVMAQDGQPARTCVLATDLNCMVGLLDSTASAIADGNWRDQTLREMAKIMAKQGRYDDAVAVIRRIDNPDTRAMTIRGIGMAAAGQKKPPESYADLFKKLTAEAEKISHPPSHAIALTYIAMAQAFAGDNAGATATAQAMENAALRNKAFAETAEIQAERGDLNAALESIGYIDDRAFRDKAHRIVSKILADRAQYDKALAAAVRIDNSYQRAQAILHIVARQVSPDEVSVSAE